MKHLPSDLCSEQLVCGAHVLGSGRYGGAKMVNIKTTPGMPILGPDKVGSIRPDHYEVPLYSDLDAPTTISGMSVVPPDGKSFRYSVEDPDMSLFPSDVATVVDLFRRRIVNSMWRGDPDADRYGGSKLPLLGLVRPVRFMPGRSVTLSSDIFHVEPVKGGGFGLGAGFCHRVLEDGSLDGAARTRHGVPVACLPDDVQVALRLVCLPEFVTLFDITPRGPQR